MKQSWAGKQRGLFTLIELLTVIVIILIIFVMLMPTLSRARGYGVRVKCVNNIKQFNTGLMMYTSENAGYTMRCVNTPSPDQGTRWVLDGARADHLINGRMWEYTPELRTYKCPSEGLNRGGVAYDPNTRLRSYSLNDCFREDDQYDPAAGEWPEWDQYHKIPNPQGAFSFTEENDQKRWIKGGFQVNDLTGQTFSKCWQDVPAYQHVLDTVVHGMADGAVQTRTLKDKSLLTINGTHFLTAVDCGWEDYLDWLVLKRGKAEDAQP